VSDDNDERRPMAMAKLKSKTVQVLGKAVERILTDERRAAKVAKAVGAVQKGMEKWDRAQEGLLRSLGIASQSDYKEVGKKITALKRRVRHLAERLES